MNDSCNLNESTDLLQDKHRNINCMIQKTFQTNYKSSVRLSLEPAALQKVGVVPRLVMPKVEEDPPKFVPLTTARRDSRDLGDPHSHSGYLNLESLRKKFHADINSRIVLPAGPLFRDDDLHPAPAQSDLENQGTITERRKSTSRSKNRDRVPNVAIRASRATLKESVLESNLIQKKETDDCQSEFHANEALPLRNLRETRPKATLGNLKRTMSLASSISQKELVPTQNSPAPDMQRFNGGVIAVQKPSNTSQTEELDMSRNLKAAQKKYSQRVLKSIPCLAFYTDQDRLFLDSQGPKNLGPSSFKSSRSDQLVLYFHSNGEDLRDLDWIGEFIQKNLHTNFLAVEYPGYGQYEGQASETNILEDAELVLGFVFDELGFAIENVVVVGRSLGSGPAVYLAAHYDIKGLVLVSAFTSIKGVASDKIGSLISGIVKEQFNNLSRISLTSCPVCIVHGADDKMVRPEHAEKLASKIPSDSDKIPNRSKIVLVNGMGHNITDIMTQLLEPISTILSWNFK